MSERTQKPLSQPHQSSCITMKLTRLLERLRNEQNPAHDKLSNDPTQEKGKEKEKEKEQGKEDQVRLRSPLHLTHLCPAFSYPFVPLPFLFSSRISIQTL